MYARIVRYEVGQPENAESFIDEVRQQFDAMQHELPGMCGSFLITRAGDGEALEVTLWRTEEDAHEADAFFEARRSPDTGAREIMMGRRAVDSASPLWDVWQGRQEWRTD